MYRLLDHFLSQQKWLDTLGGPLQKNVNSLFSSQGETGKKIKNFLNGTWFGHPLHPALTDVPVGAWTGTVALDVIGSLSNDRSLQRAADITLGVGLAGAVGSAVTGLTDWSDTYGKDRKVGLAHGLTMTATFLTYSLALIMRLTGLRRSGVMLSGLGYGLMSAGAYLGGDEVYDLGYSVNRTAFSRGPSKFVAVMPEAELPLDTPTRADANGVAIMLVKRANQVYALDDTCVHAGCSLAGGELDGASIICPCHQSQYALTDGSVINGPATMPEPHYDVRVQNGVIEVKRA